MLLDLNSVSMRWRDRRSSWRPAREPFDPDRFHVEPIAKAAIARRFVERHHYSGSFPVAIACYGLFERVSAFETSLCGVAAFSIPIQPRAASSYGAGDVSFCDLGRFLITDPVGSNAETWFLARALRLLAAARPNAGNDQPPHLVIAYSDPVPRSDACGNVRFNGHYGGIYRDSSALYLGRTKSRKLWLANDGTVLSDRAISKLRTDDNGAGYAYETLRRFGAPVRNTGEQSTAYVARALSEGPFRSIRHQGNHIYAFALGTSKERREMRQRLDRNLSKPSSTDPITITLNSNENTVGEHRP